MIKKKSKEWLKRYLPAEIVGTITAMIGASAAHAFSNNYILIAYAAVVSESVGFYSTVIVQRIVIQHKKQKKENSLFSFVQILKILADIVLEYGPAGVIDGLVLRPFFMYLFPILLGNFTLGIFVGKIVGDVTFYFFVILSYEINKRWKEVK
jgi:hypothetical protein